MKKLLLFSLLVIPLSVPAQDGTQAGPAPLRNWVIAPLPAVGYSTDLGLKLGVLCDIHYYGDGSVYPGYIHKYNIEAAYYFKGSGVLHFLYDSRYLIPKIRFTASATWLPNPVMNFFGFNGASSPYHPALDRNGGTAFYSMRRNLLRVLADFQGNIKGPLDWTAGLAFRHYKTGEVTLKKYRDGADFSLYNLYRQYGIIGEKEAGGGSHLELKAGFAVDTRNSETAPSRGVWAEALVYGSPDMFHGRGFDYLKAAVHFRHYVPVWEDRIVFAYHLAWQGTVAGEAPFYLQSEIVTPFLRGVNSEGLGGFNTLRGMLYNRIVGDGVAWGNAELRIRVARFRVAGQQWYVGVNPLFDAGMVVQPYRLDGMRAAELVDGRGLIYSGRAERPHMSAGIGLQLIMNPGFIFSVEWAKPFDSRDGTDGISAGLNYLF